MITGSHLKEGFVLAGKLLEQEKGHLDAINVYPVADGDTGTNMLMTLQGAMEKVNGHPEASIVTQELADGMLESAKGNSGVILSQFVWGFRDIAREKDNLTTHDFAKALVSGTKQAYLAVEEPKEGTILTVMRASSEEAVARVDLPKTEFLNRVYERAVEELNRTPEMLEKLGKARVIDSGAYGYVLVLEGLMRALGAAVREERVVPDKNYKETSGQEGIFCSNFLVQFDDSSEKAELKEELAEFGNSIVVLGMGSRFKIHVHAEEPDEVEAFLTERGAVEKKRIEAI